MPSDYDKWVEEKAVVCPKCSHRRAIDVTDVVELVSIPTRQILYCVECRRYYFRLCVHIENFATVVT